MARPRLESVPESLGVCPTHGQILFRTHRIGTKRDKVTPRYRRRCPKCHAERNGTKP